MSPRELNQDPRISNLLLAIMTGVIGLFVASVWGMPREMQGLRMEITTLQVQVSTLLSATPYTRTEAGKDWEIQKGVNSNMQQRLDIHSGIITRQQSMLDRHDAVLQK